jgi:hypothetical protein
MAQYQQEIAVLIVLVATGEHTLAVLDDRRGVVGEDFVSDLERVVERARGELKALASKSGRGLHEAGT